MKTPIKKFVWDTSSIINIKEPNGQGYSPGHSLFKDLFEGWIPGPYQNIFPTLAIFEVAAHVSAMKRNRNKILREFYVMDKNSRFYDVDQSLISKSDELFTKPGFDRLRGADLVFACIASIEDAYLVTKDGAFSDFLSSQLRIIDLRKSLDSPNYRELFPN